VFHSVLVYLYFNMTDYIARGKATLCNVGCVGWNGVRWVMLLCWLDLQML